MLGALVRAVALGGSLGLLLAPGTASSQTFPAPVTPVTVSYDAPPDCGSQAEFEARVRGRTRSRTLEPTRDARPSRFEVSVRRDQERVLGSLTIYETSGDANTREIEAASCSEAIDGLALIAALTLDPTSRDRPEPPQPEPEPAAQPAPTPTSEPPPPAVTEPTLDVQPSSRKDVVFRMDGAISGLAASGVATEGRLGLELGFGFMTTALVDSGSLFRFGVRVVQSDDIRLDAGNATLEWRAMTAGLCPAIIPLAETLWLTGCVAGEYGELVGEGRETNNPRQKTSPWAALGPALLARWEVLSPLFLQVGGEALFPLNRDRFLLADATVYEIPAVSARGQVGLGVLFW